MHRALRFSSRIAALAVLGVGLVALPPLADVAADDLDSELEVAPATEAAVVAPIPTLDPVLSPLTEDRLFRDSTVALQVVDIATGQEVYAYNADQALNPASTMKVITAATALRTLGPEYRFETTVDHDNTLGDAVHISPGAHLGGAVTVGDRTQVGIGASVLPNVTIGKDVIIGGGAAVVRDVPDGTKFVGVPARPL